MSPDIPVAAKEAPHSRGAGECEVSERRRAAGSGETKAAFDLWRNEYNPERPHEALGMKRPAEVYSNSTRIWSGTPDDIDYGEMAVRRVQQTGTIRYEGEIIAISVALRGWSVGLCPRPDGRIEVWFAELLVGNPPHHRTAQTIRQIHAPPLALPHPPNLGGDPRECHCCKGTIKPARYFISPEEIEFSSVFTAFGKASSTFPGLSPPPFDIGTMEPVVPPWRAIKEWIPDDEPDLDWFNQPRNSSAGDPDWFDQRPNWQPEEIPLSDGRILVLD